MHWQRTIYAGVLVAIAATIVLPWVSEAIPGGEVSLWGYQSPFIQTTCAIAGILCVACLLGDRSRPVGVLTWLGILGLSLFGVTVAAFVYVWFTFEVAPFSKQPMQAELNWPAIGAFATLFGATFALGFSVVSPFFCWGRSSETETAKPVEAK